MPRSPESPARGPPSRPAPAPQRLLRRLAAAARLPARFGRLSLTSGSRPAPVAARVPALPIRDAEAIPALSRTEAGLSHL